jgi:hypothetical protein
MRYLAGHPGLAGHSFIEDPARWLTEADLMSEAKTCNKIRAKSKKMGIPAVIGMESKGEISTCSFEDYALLYGSVLETHTNGEGVCGAPDSQISAFPSSRDPPKVLFDELNIWGHTFNRIRGLQLPDVLQRLQPSANLLITVREPVDVVYSAYNHFAPSVLEVKTSPEHFDSFIRSLVSAWTAHNCDAMNYRTCLPAELEAAGFWVARAMYSKYLAAWLEHFGCSRVHLFDVSVDPMQEVRRLYDFIGLPNDDAADRVTRSNYMLLEQSTAASENNTDGSGLNAQQRNNSTTHAGWANSMNKNTYAPMLEPTRKFLREFFVPYNREVCDLMDQYPCVEVPLFRQHCSSGAKRVAVDSQITANVNK